MKNFLAYAAAKYEAGEPIITDAEFDRLVEIHGYEKVGAGVDPTKAIPHHYRMYSLQKCFVGEKPIELPGETVETPKLDGAAVSLLYVDGKLMLALTRGDGTAGLDITEKMRLIAPPECHGGDIMQVTGEVVAKKDVPNARNYAAGALNLKSVDEFKTRDLTFIAYDVRSENCFWKSYTDAMRWIAEDGFNVVTAGEWEEFPHDGRVFRVNSYYEYEKLGWTGKHPRGAFALKEIQEGVITTLTEVVWQVGRSGVVAPVAILEPVKVGDATVSRATLNNIAYIRELNLELGCNVEIIRSGEIIPKVIRRV